MRIALTLVCCLLATRAHAGVLYSQPAFMSFTAGNLSQADAFAGADVAIAYDNFTLRTGGSVDSVSWAGWYLNAPGHVSGFSVSFWGNTNPSQPNTPTPLATYDFHSDAGEARNAGVAGLFDYSVTLPTPFLAAPGVAYWVSIQADAGTTGNWFWQTGTGGDSRSAQDVNGVRSFHNADAAFSLSGAAVPEPASWVLLAASVPVLLVAARRGRRVRQGAVSPPR